MGCSYSVPQAVPTIQNLDGTPSVAAKDVNFVESLGEYGTYKFKGVVAEPYLKMVGLPGNTLESKEWQQDSAKADKVAKAVTMWAKSKGASMVTHWFQPLGSAGVRRGQTGQVHNAMFNFGANNKLDFVFSGSELLKGETDGSSYMNGGLRATHTAGGYTALDPSSPMFIRGDTLYIPTIFISFHGKALDEKTPLLRSMDAVSKAGCRLLSTLGYECGSVAPMIGLEQEFFLVPQSAYHGRPDLQLAGRTVMGAHAARGQELCDHYMAPLNPIALACMKEMQHEAFKMGIPLNTRHREVAPNQYECAPYFGIATAQIDENLMVMELMEEIAAKHGLACLLHEKPFRGINGSGKHNNFSLATDTGMNLFNGPQTTKMTGNKNAFPTIMSAVVKAVSSYPDLMRMAIAAPGNDFRLGAMEAPPAIISTYLGEALTSFLQVVKDEKTATDYAPLKKTVNPAPGAVAPFTVPAEDRNRTSPFPYGGHRFEFRAVGSAQNVSLVNTVLNTMTASAFKTVADRIEAGEKPQAVAADLINTHVDKVVFNGDNYDEANQEMLTKRGVWRIDSGIEAIARFSDPKNTALFESMGVLKPNECEARQSVLLDHYVGTVDIEAKCMVDMITKHVLPAAKAAELPQVAALESALTTLGSAIAAVHASEGMAQAELARTLRLETMEAIRVDCDAAESACPADLWTLPTYTDMLFLDQTTNVDKNYFP